MLTVAQLQTLNTAINADPVLAAFPNDPDGALQIAELLNQIAIPDYIVWRSNISTYDIRAVLVWSEYDTLSVSKQNAFQFLCSNGIVNATLVNVRQGILSIFGSPQQVQTRTALIAIAKRKARVVEKLFATGDGTDSSPGTMTFEGQLDWSHVQNARNMG